MSCNIRVIFNDLPSRAAKLLRLGRLDLRDDLLDLSGEPRFITNVLSDLGLVPLI